MPRHRFAKAILPFALFLGLSLELSSFERLGSWLTGLFDVGLEATSAAVTVPNDPPPPPAEIGKDWDPNG